MTSSYHFILRNPVIFKVDFDIYVLSIVVSTYVSMYVRMYNKPSKCEFAADSFLIVVVNEAFYSSFMMSRKCVKIKQ